MSSEDWRRSQANSRVTADLRRRIGDMERGSPLRAGGVGAGGITIKGGSLRIQSGGNLEVDGAATFGGDTTVGGDLAVEGDATFTGKTIIGGDAEIVGTLKLPAGIIGNDALANPLDFYADAANAEGFAIPTTRADLATLEVTVPAGFTRAVVLGIGTVYGSNGTSALDYMRARVYVDNPAYSEWGRELLAPVTPNGGSAALTVTKQAVINGLVGGQKIKVRVTVQSDFATLPARPQHGATISATVIWAR